MILQKKQVAALFDLDGVVFNTEPQYSEFWGNIGSEFYPEIENFDRLIKGQTLVQIYDKWFKDDEAVRNRITSMLNDFEAGMRYEFVDGVVEFLDNLKSDGIPSAVVTSSNAEKMENVYRAHPGFKEMFSAVYTSEFFKRSKPDPDCYLFASSDLGISKSQCVVFEDSFHGISAGKSAGMKVVGLSTTNDSAVLLPLCDAVIPDFSNYSIAEMLGLIDSEF